MICRDCDSKKCLQETQIDSNGALNKLVHSKTLKQVPEEKNMKESSKASALKELQANPHEVQKSTIVPKETPPPKKKNKNKSTIFKKRSQKTILNPMLECCSL